MTQITRIILFPICADLPARLRGALSAVRHVLRSKDGRQVRVLVSLKLQAVSTLRFFYSQYILPRMTRITRIFFFHSCIFVHSWQKKSIGNLLYQLLNTGYISCQSRKSHHRVNKKIIKKITALFGGIKVNKQQCHRGYLQCQGLIQADAIIAEQKI